MRVEARPESEAARLAAAIYADVLDAVRSDVLVRSRLSVNGPELQIGDWRADLNGFERIIVVGAGKAAVGMSLAVEQALGDRITEGIVVTKYGHAQTSERIEILEAAHPTPDAASVEAGRRIHALATCAQPGDLVICLLSGGASSLMEMPREPLPLDDLRATSILLMRAGAPIQDLNAVRACLSQLKAGGLARAACPAATVCLALSDVLGNSLEVIGSGPCVDTPADPARALAVLDSYRLREKVPPAVLDLLQNAPKMSRAPAPEVHHIIVGDIHTAIGAARESAIRNGLRPMTLTSWLEGEAREVGRVVGAIARDMVEASRDSGFDCLILGGETTVTVRGSGSGGRSQEIAVAALDSMRHVEGVAVLAGSTDGTDGPTDAAGGLAEQAIAQRADRLGLNSNVALAASDSYTFLEAAEGLLMTGPTQSNVGDIVIIVKR
jgi:glycerate-2-kinase